MNTTPARTQKAAPAEQKLLQALARSNRHAGAVTGVKKELCEAIGIEFAGYQESMNRIHKIIGMFEAKKEQLVSAEHTPSAAFVLALKAQCAIIGQLNSGHINCPVPWDFETGFPSHPPLVADVAAYVKKHQPSGYLGAVLASFSEWTCLYTGETRCACTRKGISFSLRSVPIEVMIRHLLQKHDKSGLVVTQMIGIRTDDENHFGHYEIKAESRCVDHTMIIWVCENCITLNPFAITPLEHKHVEQLFTVDSLVSTMRELLETTF